MVHSIRSRFGAAAFFSALCLAGCTQSPYPALDAITEDDLVRDVTALAHDDFFGREAGTVD